MTFFSNFYAIRLLIWVISDLKVNYLSDLHEICHTKQLKDGKCNEDNYFLNF